MKELHELMASGPKSSSRQQQMLGRISETAQDANINGSGSMINLPGSAGSPGEAAQERNFNGLAQALRANADNPQARELLKSLSDFSRHW